jgi:SAM-dependent methyltransferase
MAVTRLAPAQHAVKIARAAPVRQPAASSQGERDAAQKRRVLHVGCGAAAPGKLHAVFREGAWTETRLDVDPSVAPDIICSIGDMKGAVEDGCCDAIWSSHNVEHLETHEVAGALGEFVRVLRPTGFAMIRCPDVQSVAQFILDHGVDAVAYESPAGPITPLDMLFGHNASVRRGQRFMRHGTAFTEDRLGRDLVEAGFAEVRTARRPSFDLWAVAFMPEADSEAILTDLAASGLDLRTHP